jgi:hypothetical protein
MQGHMAHGRSGHWGAARITYNGQKLKTKRVDTCHSGTAELIRASAGPRAVGATPWGARLQLHDYWQEASNMASKRGARYNVEWKVMMR